MKWSAIFRTFAMSPPRRVGGRREIEAILFHSDRGHHALVPCRNGTLALILQSTNWTAYIAMCKICTLGVHGVHKWIFKTKQRYPESVSRNPPSQRSAFNVQRSTPGAQPMST